MQNKLRQILFFFRKLKIEIESRKFVYQMIKNGKIKELTKEEKREVKNYWKKFNKKINLNWNRYFKHVNKNFDVKYITEEFLFDEIVPKLNDLTLTKAYVDKNYYDKHYSNIAKPKTIFRNINNVFYDEDYKILNKTLIIKILESLNGEFIIKPSLDTGGGKNIKKIEIKTGKIYYKNLEIKIEELMNEYKSDYLIQEFIKQNEFFSQLFPKSLNTMRIMTYREGEEFYILGGSLNLGRNNSEITNMAQGGIVIGIDIETGKLNEYGITEKVEFIKEKHPDTNVVFANEKIPYWERITESLKEWSKEIPAYFKLVSWDLTLDNNNIPIFIEINLKYQGVELCQLNGPLFGEKTEYFLNKIINK